MRAFAFYGLVAVWMAGLQPAATAGIFSGPSSLNVFLIGAGQPGWDYSGLSLVDTPDGMKFSGTVTAHFTEEFAHFEMLQLTGTRNLNVASGADLTVLSQITGATVTTTGPITVSAIVAAAYISNALCYVQIGPLLSAESSVTSPVVAGPATSSCTSPGGGQLLNYLQINAYSPVGGDATLTIDFGNSVIGEAYQADAVPEPSTLLLFATALPLITLLRRR